MAVTIIYADRASSAPSAFPRGDDLWLSFGDLAAATGWEVKPHGMCLGERCVPLSPALESDLIADGRLNLAAFSRYLASPVVHDDAAAVWLFGASAAARGATLRSLDAPDFRLPDLDGATHALSDYRGKKVLLLSWASW